MATEENFQTSQDPIMCANGCGFFGSAANINLCSKCYKDYCIKQADMEKSFSATTITEGEPLMSCTVTSATTTTTTTTTTADAGIGMGNSVMEKSSDSTMKNRCFSCNKRVRLMGFPCRCGSTFCSVHRYPEEHECTFDFKTVGRQAITKANPVLKADKLQRF